MTGAIKEILVLPEVAVGQVLPMITIRPAPAWIAALVVNVVCQLLGMIKPRMAIVLLVVGKTIPIARKSRWVMGIALQKVLVIQERITGM
ncbi:hypothetical protein ES703_26466 [subsurface metagenome]